MDSNHVISDCFDEVLKQIPIHRWERMRESMNWTEYIDGEEYQFDILVLENTEDYVHIGVGVTYYRAEKNGTPLSPNMGNNCSSFILEKKASGRSTP